MKNRGSPIETPKAPRSAKPYAEPEVHSHGYVDSFGYVEGVAGWFFVGWTNRLSGKSRATDCLGIGQFDRGGIGGKAIVSFFGRPDLDTSATGVIAFVPGNGRVVGKLVDLRLQYGAETLRAIATDATHRVSEQELLNRVRSILVEFAVADPNRLYLLRLIARPMYQGEETISTLPSRVLLEFDEIIFCPPAGLLIIGWQLAAMESGHVLRLRSGQLSTEFSPDTGARIPRPDVIAAIGKDTGFSDLDCGMIAYLPNAYSAGDATFVEIETSTGAVAFKNLRVSPRRGMDAIRRVLEIVHVRYGRVDRCFDNVVGPAVAALNRARLGLRTDVAETAFGRHNETPTYSIVVPLYGRIDFIEYQMAQFSRDKASGAYELIYVLDDPARRSELEGLARSLFERYQIPFRLLMLSRNLGFAPSNNIGLKAARGKFICFLNSDAFPDTVDWLEALSKQLLERPDIGAIGPRLLYEDGSVQHEGCTYERIPEFGNWNFLAHENKARRPSESNGLRSCPAITGACIVMDRQFAIELGGFDEAYVLGDFEDSDLCMKIHERGRLCAVAFDIRMFHLERKSQGSPSESWRQNLTLYNAWVHERRWFPKTQTNVDALQTER